MSRLRCCLLVSLHACDLLMLATVALLAFALGMVVMAYLMRGCGPIIREDEL